MIYEHKTSTVPKTLALFNAIIHADKTTTVGEIRPLIDALDAVRFNRPKVNHQLSNLRFA
ncbi:hypothetical protein [Xenorhabdus bovienii]|uniref:hypothetical protein n=1 Tax=Xenorhabdus bovienii TaxID=40576 RepID=UPI0023B2BD48|nr:hypothetical protein [Xenorhabdus bovienii]MDE9539692.1 hypothetical protein [Xenorhabdus bovienii]